MKKLPINVLILLILLFHLILMVFLGFTAWPEMTLWPYLVLKGWLPYRDIAMAHNLLLVFDLALVYKIFGLTLLNLKLYTWMLIILTDVLVYLIGRKLTGSRRVALLSVLFYVLWQPFFEGNGLWFDLALAPVALLIFFSLWKKEFFWSGIFLGIAILIKQTAVWFIVPMIGEIWLMRPMRLKTFWLSAIGTVIPLVFFALYLLATNTLSDFYFWAMKFGIFYLPKAPGQVELPTVKQILALVPPLALILPALFLKKERKLILMLLVWFIFASLGVYPRWSLFHFQPALPFLAIISGMVIAGAAGYEFSRRTVLKYVFALIIIFVSLYLQFWFYKLNWRQGDRFFEESTLKMASWMKKNTRPNEKVFIFNTWDNLYVLSNTLPATRPWVPTLPWYLEYPGIQGKMVADLEKNKPEFVILEPYQVAGLGSYQPGQIDKFMKVNYTLKEAVAGRFWVLIPR